ncbi:glycosyltransferase family 4 protein, partial [Patescibacteria group bacterium]|nr:glycosyltransferase family 4 protein [Patescibacteria group bacterium]
EDVPKYLAISDVFVRPSLSEGLGNSFLEAMAAGVPIIGTKVGGIPDFLRDGETGLFCEARNPQSIAEKITLLLSDEILRQRLIANARKLVEEKYNWDNIAQKMGNIFEKLAD